MDLFPWNELRAIGIHNKPDAALLKVAVYFGVVDHLAEQEYPVSRIVIKGPVADFDGVLHPIAESEVPGQVEDDRAEIKPRRAEVLLSRIEHPSDLLDSSGNGRPVIDGNVELFDGREFDYAAS